MYALANVYLHYSGGTRTQVVLFLYSSPCHMQKGASQRLQLVGAESAKAGTTILGGEAKGVLDRATLPPENPLYSEVYRGNLAFLLLWLQRGASQRLQLVGAVVASVKDCLGG